MSAAQFAQMQTILAEAFMPLVGLWVIGVLVVGVIAAIVVVWLIVLREKLSIF